MTYYNLCGINSKHSNISKRRGGGYILKIITNLYVTCNDVTLLMNILYNTLLESGGTKDHFRWVKVPGAAPF